MATTFLDPTTDATGGFDFYTALTGGISSSIGADGVSTIAVSGGFARAYSVMADAGRRINVWWQFGSLTGIAGVDRNVIGVHTADGNNATLVLAIHTDTNVLHLQTNATVLGTGSIDVKTGTPLLRITLCYTITSTSVWSAKVYVNGVLDINVSNSPSLAAITTGRLQIGDSRTVADDSGGSLVATYSRGIYIDSDTSLADPGPIIVAAERPYALNTNNFSTLGGSATNRWDYVAEVPASITNYIVHTSATDVQENFPVKWAGFNLRFPMIARLAWIYAKRGPLGSTTPVATGSGASKAAGTNISAALSASVGVGDIVVVAVADQMTSTVSFGISDTLGHTWTALSGPTTNTIRASKWYVVVTNAGSMTVSATFTSQTASRAIVAAAWSAGLFSASPLDTNVTNANDSTTPFTSPLSGTLAQATEIVLAFNFAAGDTVVTATSPNLLAIAVASSGGGAATNASVAIGYQAVSATTSIAPVFAGTSRTSVQGTASLKYNTSGVKAAGTPKLMDDGTESAVVLTTSAALYQSAYTDTTTHPGLTAIGMRSSGAGGADTYLYECGQIIAYKRGPLVTRYALSQAVNRAATY